MRQAKINRMPKMEAVTPVTIIAAKQYLDRIDFVNQINSLTKWDQARCKVSPGQLALAVVLTTFVMVRFPLYKVDSLFRQMDVELLFGEGISADDFNDDAIARMLDKIHAAGCSSLFFQLAMKAYVVFDISLNGGFHVDTSSICLFGEYDDCEKEGYQGVDITRGYSKDHRPDLKQFMIGNVVNPQGIPLYHKTLDGNTADCIFNQETIVSLSQLLGEKIKDFTYIADSKLVNLNNLALLNQPNNVIPFISRCPDNFYQKLTNKVKQLAYQADKWRDIGSLKEDKHHVGYQVQTYTERIVSKKDKLDAEFRLVVVKNSLGQETVTRKLEKEKLEISKAIKEIEGKTFSCEPDARKVADALCHQYRHNLLDVRTEIHSVTIEKRKRGNPGKNPVASEQVTSYKIHATIIGENQQRVLAFKQQQESFVLITNKPADQIDEAEILWQYKGQHAVEVQFHLLKQPALAANVWLKKPERIEALAMLLHVSLLIRSLMQHKARERVKEMEQPPRIDFNNAKLQHPTAEKILGLLHGHSLISRGGQYYHSYCTAKDFDRLMILFDLLDINANQLIA